MPFLLDQPIVGFRDRPLLFIDLELTGLDAATHEIIEVAALRVDQPGFRVVNSYYTKVSPAHIETADPRALKLIGYNPRSWAGAIPLRQVLVELSQFSPDSILAGWSVQTEWDFLNAALAVENLPHFFTHRLLEVSTLAFVKLYDRSDLTHLNLPAVARALGIHIDRHKPDSDIRATYEIFKRLIS